MKVRFKHKRNQETYLTLLGILKDQQAAFDLTSKIVKKREHTFRNDFTFKYKDMVMDGLDALLDLGDASGFLSTEQLIKLEAHVDLVARCIIEERYGRDVEQKEGVM